jgi:septum formation protein
MNSIILASQSPRRAELLRQMQVDFTVLAVDIDESCHPDETPLAYAQRLALQKAQTAWQRSAQDKVVLGADTVVVSKGHILGKPKDLQDCRRMLRLLSGDSHEVLTAVALVTGEQQLQALVTTEVGFKVLSPAEIDWYWQTGEPADKAGAYAIQGIGGQFVLHIKGSYSAVVGLPLYETRQLLSELDMPLVQ